MLNRPKKPINLTVSGTDLVQAFSAALGNRYVIESMKSMANTSEEEALQSVTAATAAYGAFMAPQHVSEEQQAEIARASMDAHLQKAQFLRAQRFSDHQMAAMHDDISSKYVGQKAVVQVIESDPWPVDTFWQDARTGQVRVNEHGPKKVIGIIERIDLDTNSFILRPTKLAATLNKSVLYHEIYVVHPKKLSPMVTISIV